VVAALAGARVKRPSRPAPDASRTRPPGGGRSRWTEPLVLSLLALATCAAFAGVLQNDWIRLDDPTYIVENTHVNVGWTWEGFLWFLHEPHSANWHPITSYSHMLDVQLFGLHAGAHHAVSVVFHAANVLLLVLLLRRLTGDWWRSVLVGALFGLHPLRVESVAWASERKDVLSMFFFLLTIGSYHRWVMRPGPARYGIVVLMLALGLMSKPMLVTTPIVLVLLDLWPLGRWSGGPDAARSRAGSRPAAPVRSFAGLVLEKWPLFMLAAASAVVTILVQRASGAMPTTDAVSVGHRLANAVVTCWRYIGKTAWPVNLIPIYPDRPLHAGIVALCTVAFVAVSAVAIAQVRKRPHLTVGWSWYVVTLLPVIGLIQVGLQAFADRYTYIPTLGILLMVVWSPIPRRAVKPLVFASVLAVATLLVLTRRQVALWKDTRTLFTEAIRVTPENAAAHQGLGEALAKEQQADAAIREFELAIRIDPGYMQPYLSLAETLHGQGRDAEALPYCEIAAKLKPNEAQPYIWMALCTLGSGKLEEAAGLYRRAIALEPNNTQALRGYAILRAVQGHVDEAVTLLRNVESREPGDPYTQVALAKAIHMSGGSDAEAAAHLRRAISLKPDWAEPVSTLALLLATTTDGAVRDTGEASRLSARAAELTARQAGAGVAPARGH
jgi:tetratricopeptide (TPR) repeat protein